jgi:methionyl-tRNA formyltransferase
MRRWFGAVAAKDVLAEAERLGVEVHIVPSVNSPETEALMRPLDLDLGISLGNGFIASRIFGIPRHGMINYHGELLPDYPGALSIIWPIHDRRRETGFTIHRVARKIDGGDIILQRRFPIVFGGRLRDTVELTGATIHPHIGEAFSEVLGNWDTLSVQAIPQDSQKSFTTPSIRQYVRMVINNRFYYKSSQNH